MDTRPPNGMPRSGLRISNGLLAFGSAAVMSIYTAGNLRTRAAASRFADEDEGRRRPAAALDANGVTAGAAIPAPAEQGGTAPLDSIAQGAEVGGGMTPVVPASATAAEAASAAGASPPSTAVSVAMTPSGSALPMSATGTTPLSSTATSASGSVTASAQVVATTMTSPASSMPIPSAVTPSAASAQATTVVPPSPVSPVPIVAATVSAASPPAPSSSPDSASTIKTAAAEGAKTVWRDGTFSGWGTSRHGDIEATVVIEGGRITGASITRCLTRYSCSLIAHLQKQVITRQSPDVDYVSGATQSANAFYYAILEALKASK